MELKFRKMLADQKAEYEAKIAEQEENLNFYREYHTKQRNEIKQLTATVVAQNEKIATLKRRTERLAAVFAEDEDTKTVESC